MGIRTAIEYCDSTVNPIMGCTGCELYNADPGKNHCYAATLINRYAGKKGWPKRFNEPEFFPGRLEKAINWSDLAGKERPDKPWLNGLPRVIFVNDLSDGFCPDVDPMEWLAPHLEKMGQSPHIWLLLTKWPKAMGSFCERHPLPINAYPGVTVLRQRDEWRIRELLNIPAARRWLSCEPLLGPTHLDKAGAVLSEEWWVWGNAIHWCIIGGESGPGARPMHPAWVRNIRDQCWAAGVPLFFKQWGAWLPFDQRKAGQLRDSVSKQYCDYAWRIGKKAAGHLLDGREYRQFPDRMIH